MDIKWIINTILIPVAFAAFYYFSRKQEEAAKKIQDIERAKDVLIERVDHLKEMNQAHSDQIRSMGEIMTKLIERVDARKDSLDKLTDVLSRYLDRTEKIIRGGK